MEHLGRFESGRRCGKTTRLIDQVVQEFFKKGEIHLFTGRRTYESDFVDPDAEDGNEAQDFFVAGLLRRLGIEHNSQFAHTHNNGYHVFKLK